MCTYYKVKIYSDLLQDLNLFDDVQLTVSIKRGKMSGRIFL